MAETVPVPRALLVRAALLLGDRLSKSGHAMQQVTEESRGHCTVRGEAQVCVEHRRLLRELMDAAGVPRRLEEYRERQRRGLSLLGEAAG